MECIIFDGKGEKRLSKLAVSVARRHWKYVLLGSILATILLKVGKRNDGKELRASCSTRITQGNVALRPLDDRPDAKVWHSLTRDEMASPRYLHCDYDRDRDIHGPEIWIGLREAYGSVLGPEASTIETTKASPTAFRVPVDIRRSPGAGRGIFAGESFRKGRILYDFSKSAQFRNPFDFREFLRVLAPELACDVLMWSYVQFFGEGTWKGTPEDYSELRIVTDLDTGSFCNDGGQNFSNMAWLDADGERPAETSRYHPPHPEILRSTNGIGNGKAGEQHRRFVKSSPLVAIRDIEKGEELLCWYFQFSEGLDLMIP